MKFQTKLILTYSLFITLILLIIGILFYQQNVSFYKQNLRSTYTLLNRGMVRQLDDLYKQMDFILLNFLSDDEVKVIIENLAVLDHGEEGFNEFYADALTVFKSNLQNYSILKNFHSIQFFNNRGDFFSSNFSSHHFYSIDRGTLESLAWTAKPYVLGNNSIIISPYKDPWTGESLFGLGRRIPLPGGVYSFIAAQRSVGDLKEITALDSDKNLDILILTHSGEVFYSSPGLEEENLSYLGSLENFNTRFSSNPVSGFKEQYFYQESGSTGLRCLLILRQDILLDSTIRTGILILIGFFIVSLVSLLYSYYSSSFLTRPLREIIRIMEGTELHEEPLSMDMDVRHDEVIDLSNAFYKLMERLKKANKREVQYTAAWLQVRFDALQEQIHPHFIFNTLTVISKRAFEIGDDEICETCDSLADMLRYSASTAQRSAAVRDEVHLAESYLLLMKKRLGRKLNYELQTDESLMDITLPKIILHQLVENALSHGFKSVNRDRELKIITEALDDESWCFRVEDNGEGFDPDVLTDLENRIQMIRDGSAEKQMNDSFQIGGMGLVNTFLRLHLYFHGRVDLQINSSRGGGSSVSFIMPRGRSAEDKPGV